MKLKINRDHFANGLATVLGAVATKASMPVLSNVLLTAKAGQLAILASNLDIAISCSVPAEVLKDGAITLPAKRLAGIVREMPTVDVLLEALPTLRVTISGGGSKFQIAGMGAEEFPAIPPAAANEKSFSIQQEALADMLSQVEYAQSSDETRFILNGVLFESTGKKLTTVATDGRRLALVAAPVENWPTFRAIVPAKALGDVRRTLGCGNAVKVTMTERRTTFSFDTEESNGSFIGPIELHSKVVEGNYPDYMRVVPKDKMESVKLVRAEFQNCIKRASLVTSEKSNSVRLGFTPGKLSISASSPDFGEAHEEMQIEYAGPRVDVAFNPTFLLDPLTALPNDEVKFEFQNETSPGVIKAGESFACVVMPVRLS